MMTITFQIAQRGADSQILTSCTVLLVWLLWSVLLYVKPRFAKWAAAPTRAKSKYQIRAERPAKFWKTKPKPKWCVNEIIRLAAIMRGASHRMIAATFNARFGIERRETVSKSTVGRIVKKHRYDMMRLRRALNNRRPFEIEPGTAWGIDFTHMTDITGAIHSLFGAVDHGSRRCLALLTVRDKLTISVIEIICKLIRVFGKPKLIRSDNEPCFTSKLFALVMRFLGVRHQLTRPHSPWENGRIERFFGTLKRFTRQLHIESGAQLLDVITHFTFHYNFIRPHQNLHWRTPMSVWNRKLPAQEMQELKFFSSFDGLLSGWYGLP
jgi:putative transposase